MGIISDRLAIHRGGKRKVQEQVIKDLNQKTYLTEEESKQLKKDLKFVGKEEARDKIADRKASKTTVVDKSTTTSISNHTEAVAVKNEIGEANAFKFSKEPKPKKSAKSKK